MFLGEALCLLPFAARRWYKAATRATPLSAEEQAAHDHRLRRSFWVFGLPALCDAAASTMLNLGLFYTCAGDGGGDGGAAEGVGRGGRGGRVDCCGLVPAAPEGGGCCCDSPPPVQPRLRSYASVYQMLRGTLVIFAGLLTIALLHRRLHSHHWLGMVLICAGAALVGASSVIYDRTGDRPGGELAAAPGQALQQAGSGAPAAGLRRMLALDFAALPWGGSDGVGSGTASDPLLGNILVVVAQVGCFGGRQAVAARWLAGAWPRPSLLGRTPALCCPSAAAGRLPIHSGGKVSCQVPCPRAAGGEPAGMVAQPTGAAQGTAGLLAPRVCEALPLRERCPLPASRWAWKASGASCCAACCCPPSVTCAAPAASPSTPLPPPGR